MLDPCFDDMRHRLVVHGLSRSVYPMVWDLLTVFRERPDQDLAASDLHRWLFGAAVAKQRGPSSVQSYVSKLRTALRGSPFEVVSKVRGGQGCRGVYRFQRLERGGAT